MDALATALPVYGFATAITHQSSLWINLKDEVLNPSDERCETAALASIKSLTACLGSAPTPPGASVSPLQSFLEGAVEACLGNLKTPGVKLAKPSGRLLVEIASASPLSFAHVIDQTVSVLLDIFKTDTMITSKRTIMDILVKYVSAGRKLYGSIATSAPVSQEKDKMDGKV